jgi:hypothetical protein
MKKKIQIYWKEMKDEEIIEKIESKIFKKEAYENNIKFYIHLEV